MNTSVHRSFGLLLLILCTCCLTVKSQKAQTSTLKGHITLKGQPIAGVSVCVRQANANSARSPAYRGRSDQDGNYRVTNIPNGSYQVTLEAPEFFVAENLSNRSLILGDGETVEDFDFALTRGGVITGKVTASGNRPLIAQQIVLRFDRGGAQLSTQRASETDDRGIYRIFGLRPGKYKVSVTPQNNYVGTQKSRFNETFYPTTTDPAKSVVVEVTESAEVTGIDIAVEMNEDSESRFSVSGRVIDEGNQQPVANVGLGLQRTQDNDVNYLNVWATSDAKGQFKFEDLSPGKYAVVFRGGVASQADNNLSVENTGFVLVDKDVEDLLVKAVRKATVSGVVVLEAGQSKATLSQFGPLFLNALVAKESSGVWAESARIAPDGSFFMKGLLSGIAKFSLGAMHGGLSKGLSIGRVERDGIVQNPGLEIKDQEMITGVRIVLKYANGMIRGVVKLTNGDLPANARVSVWVNNSQVEPAFQTMAAVDARGHFFVDGLADGSYEIGTNLFFSESQRGPLTTKQQVSVSSGSVTEVTLTVEPRSNP